MRTVLPAASIIAILVATTSVLAQAPNAGAPWRQGELAAGDWRVEQVVDHPEFMRFELSRESSRTTVEVVAHDGPPGEWTSRHHRLQPAPGVQADEGLMRALLAELRAWDDRAANPAIAAHGSGGGLRDFDGLDMALLLTNALLLALVLLLVAGPLWTRPALLAWSALALAATAAGWWWLFISQEASDLPLTWITVLHEGPTSQNIEFLYGRNRHTGPNHTLMTWLLAGDGRFGLRDMVRLNLGLAGLNAAMLLAIGRALLGRLLPALLIVALFAGNAAAVHAAASELAAGLSTTLFLLATAAVLALGDPATASPWRRWGTLLAVVLATALMGMTRTEAAGFGLVALATLIARMTWGDEALGRLSERVWLRARQSGWPLRIALIVLGLGTLPLMWVDGRIGWLIAGLHPLNPSFLAAIPLLMTLLPLGALLLIGFGAVWTLRRWRQTLLLPVALLILFRVYFCASHLVFYEMLRYVALLLPAFAILAMLGWRELAHQAHARGWRPRWRKLALGVLAVAMFVPPLPPLADAIWDRRPPALPSPGTLLAPPLDADQQAEVRFMLAAVEQHPQCVIATRTTREIERVEAPRSYDWWLFGKPLPAPLTRSAAEISLEAWLDKRLPGVPCVLFFRGLDCHLVDALDCEQLVARRPMVESMARDSKPYSDPWEYGAVHPKLELALFRLR